MDSMECPRKHISKSGFRGKRVSSYQSSSTISVDQNQSNMAKSNKYLTDIREQVKADHNGMIPKNLELTIKNYAAALELRDVYREKVIQEPTVYMPGSMGQPTMKQNPLCNLLYQQEALCQNYAKMLGLTAAKAAVKTEAIDTVGDDDPMANYYRGKQ